MHEKIHELEVEAGLTQPMMDASKSRAKDYFIGLDWTQSRVRRHISSSSGGRTPVDSTDHAWNKNENK
jgi:hypothetical protein